MAEVNLTLLAIAAPILLGAGIGLATKNAYVGGGGATVLLSWIATQTENNFIMGAWLLILTFMGLAVARQMAGIMLGETA